LLGAANRGLGWPNLISGLWLRRHNQFKNAYRFAFSPIPMKNAKQSHSGLWKILYQLHLSTQGTIKNFPIASPAVSAPAPFASP